MSGLFSTYVPQDRRQALARGQDLPDRMWGAALFADISGFTPLAESLSLALGPQLGAEELTGLLNRVFGALITEVERYGGSVIGFAGDAITCWFDDRSGEFAALRGALDSPDTQHATPHTPHWAATLRAAACGLAMQCAMAPFAEVAIRQGVAARLAVKVAVAAGPARRFLVGDPQRGLLEVLAGSTLDRLAAAERLALRGEVVLEAESANGLAGCLDIAGWREAGGVRVAVVGGLRSAVRPDPWPALADADLPPELARRWIALAVAERIEASGHLLAQLRPAVALFLQFGEIDYDGDDRAGPLLDAYVRDVQSVVAHFGGCLVQLTIGDKGSYAYAVFGAPHAHDDNAARAVEAALALRASPPHAPIRTVRIGVAQGWMYAGSYGGPTRRTYGALGDRTNVAARLMSLAPPGAIRCDEAVAHAAARRWRFTELPPVHLKGRRLPMPVFEPGGEIAHEEAARGRASVALVGRAAELALLCSALGEARAGQGRLILLEGEAGVGKSRLLDEMGRLARDQGMEVLTGAGHSIEQHTPYRAWRDVFAAFFGLRAGPDLAGRRALVERVAADHAPETLARLPLLNDVLSLELPDTSHTEALDPALRQEGLAFLAVALLRARAHARPLVLVLENAHWLDSLSWALAVQVARAMLAAGAPFVMVVAHRPTDQLSLGGRGIAALRALDIRTSAIALGPLEPGQVAELVAARLGLPPGATPAALTELVYERSGGNPFFAEELLSHLLDQGVIALERGIAGGPPACVVRGEAHVLSGALPDTVQGLVLARIDRLPPDWQLILKIAAVLGPSFSYRPLHAVLNRYRPIGERALHVFMEELVRRDFVVLERVAPEPAYAFRHTVTQQVAYDMLLFAHRKEMHAAAADWYEQAAAFWPYTPAEQHYPLLVHHCHHAEDQARERRYAILAGESAAARFANAEAVRYVSRALELTPHDDPVARFDLLVRREAVNDLRGERQEQARDLDDLAVLAVRMGDGQRLARVELRLATYQNEISRYAAASRRAEGAARLAQEAGDPALEASAELQWGRALGLMGRTAEARERYSRALAIARAASLPALEAHSTRALAHAAIDLEEVEMACATYERAIALSEAIGDRRGAAVARGTLGWVLTMRGEYLRARAMYHESLAMSREIGLRTIEARVLDGLGAVAAALGDYAAARALHEEALALFVAIGDRQGESDALSNIAAVLLADGACSAAVDAARRAVQLAREQSARRYESKALAALGHAALALGRMREASAAYGQSLELRRRHGQPYLALEPQAGLALVALAGGRLDEALAHASAILHALDPAVARGWVEPYWVDAACIRVLRAASDPRAEDLLRRARGRLLAHAGALADAAIRRSFLENIAVHRELRDL